MKRRRHQPAMLRVRVAFARQQSLAEQPLRSLEAAALSEVPAVSDQNVLDEMRIADEHDLLAPHLVGRHVTVGALQSGEEPERIATGPIQEPVDERRLRPRQSSRSLRPGAGIRLFGTNAFDSRLHSSIVRKAGLEGTTLIPASY